MSIWINALGIGGIGAVYGYVLFYALKRYLPPVTETPPAIKELVFLLASLGASGAIGASVASLSGVNYIGPYGLGLFAGATANIVITLFIEASYCLTSTEVPAQMDPTQHPSEDKVERLDENQSSLQQTRGGSR